MFEQHFSIMCEMDERLYPFKMYKTRFMMLKEWKHKTPPEIAFKKINSSIGKKLVSPSKINEWYTKFDEGDFELFEKKSKYHVSQQFNKTSASLNDSIVLFTDDEDLSWNMATKDGRFLIFPCNSYDLKDTKMSSFITIYDLFKGTKKTNFVSSVSHDMHFITYGDYLLFVRRGSRRTPSEISCLKINYDDLSIEKEFKSISLGGYVFIGSKRESNQLKGQKFAIFGDIYITIVKLFQDESKFVVHDQISDYQKEYKFGQRLWNNKLQGFGCDQSHNLTGTMTFLEFDLETKEKTKRNAPLNLEDCADLECADRFVKYWFDPYCWTDDCVYTVFKTLKGPEKLFVFDSKTLNWTNIGITTTNAINIFVDENEFLTLYVKEGDHKDTSAVYRIALRKPDTLVNLTKLCAVRESNLYGNDGYVKISRQL